MRTYPSNERVKLALIDKIDTKSSPIPQNATSTTPVVKPVFKKAAEWAEWTHTISSHPSSAVAAAVSSEAEDQVVPVPAVHAKQKT